ncbi:Fanconi anemia group C protein isoform X4 [Stegostoma tigrinum]|uniref:Fanconi anemia group C protein isoform X4 n=1 Tax=Stegostoma tigrinum TaxID=3053191 RepID=UPI00202AE80E|nr:Fanconi anemia group C protein isoform X4 [Stegostoma tigrinum]
MSLLRSLTGVDQEIGRLIQTLHYPEEEYHSKLLKNMVSTLVKELQGNQCNRASLFIKLPPERLRSFSVLCSPIVTLIEVLPLVEALLTCREDNVDEALCTEFLESVSTGILQKNISLSDNAVMSLWLRYLPSLEQAILHLTETLITHSWTSLLQVEVIIRDSLLPKAAACHPSLFRVLDHFFRTILLESDGHPKIITIIQAFTRCFVQALLRVQPQIPLKLYFPTVNQSLVMALLVHPSDMPSAAWSQHLISIFQILKRNLQDEEDTETSASIFESWFLLVRFGDWVNVALQQLMTANDISEMLLWLLIFYYKPHMENQQESNLMEHMKSVYNQVKILINKTSVTFEEVQTALVSGNLYKEQSHFKDLISHLLLSFLLFSTGGHRLAKESVQLVITATWLILNCLLEQHKKPFKGHLGKSTNIYLSDHSKQNFNKFTLVGTATGGISEMLAATAHRLKNKGCGASEDDKVQSTIELLQQQLHETQSENMQYIY